MSQDNLDVAGRLVGAFNDGDLERFLDDCDPELELRSRFTALGGVYSGHLGARRWHQDLLDTWEYLRIEVERFIDVDDHTVILLLALHGKGRASGVELRQDIAHLATFRAGKMVRIVSYADPGEALEAVGLREQPMSQESIEVVQSLYDAINRRDLAEAVAHFHPEAEVYPAVVGLDVAGPGSARRLCGRDEVRQFFVDNLETWEAWTVEAEDFTVTPDGRVLAVERWHARGRRGIVFDFEVIDLYTLREGLVVQVDGFLDKTKGLAAVGLRE